MKHVRFVLAAVLIVLAARTVRACVVNWAHSQSAPFTAAAIVREGDVNGDGLTDVLGAGTTTVRLLLTTPQGIGAQTIVTTTDYLGDFALADVQNDGKLDLILADVATNTVEVLPGNGDGTFGTAVTTVLAIAPTRILLRDFTGDGKIDVALRSYSASTIAILAGDGANGFTELARTPLHEYNTAFGAGDFDDDGMTDLVVPYLSSTRVDVLFGNGNGTFDPAVQLTGGDDPADVAVADLDGDGDDDFVTADWTGDTMTAVRHVGARAFSVVTYDAMLQGSTFTDPYSIRVADVTQDGHLDVVLVSMNAQSIATFFNEGDGTFADMLPVWVGDAFSGGYSGYPTAVTVGQFTGDSRIDLLLVSSYNSKAALFPNNCGESSITVQPQAPVISVGQEAEIAVLVHVPGDGYFYPETRIRPSGTVTIMDGATELASGPLNANGSARLTLTGLPAGEHSLEVAYSGDAYYHPETSDPFVQKVTTATTSVTLSISDESPPLIYGNTFTVLADVTSSSDGGSPTGELLWYVDGVERQNGSQPYLHELQNAGTHTYQVRYSGNASYPPSASDVFTVQVAKDQVASMQTSNLKPQVRAGSPIPVEIYVQPEHDGAPNGVVRLYEGATLLASAAMNGSWWADLEIPSLPVGTHTFRAVFADDPNILPYEIGGITITVLPDAPVPFAAFGGSSIVAHWMPTGNAYSYALSRLTGGTWQTVSGYLPWYTPTYTLPNPQAGVVYTLRVQGFDQGGQLVHTSHVDVAMLTSFSDDPLTAGTKVRAQHLSELVQMTNVLRSSGGLAPISLSGAGAGQRITASHLNTLRDAINAGRAAHGATPVTFTDVLTAAATRIKALHVRELRDALR
ncbi:MAG TPA: Ig-like domain repeat protein [Thermoanaerobaculia bacterium]|nr:Ig-like domain repeat protein [Thermoanaerobaculia bacterium]